MIGIVVMGLGKIFVFGIFVMKYVLDKIMKMKGKKVVFVCFVFVFIWEFV